MANDFTISGNETSKELKAKVDSGDTYTADARAITRFVSRYIQDQLNEEELEQIGDLLEGAEFIDDVGPGSDGIIAQVVFQMSTPTAKGPISKEAAERWLGLLAD